MNRSLLITVSLLLLAVASFAEVAGERPVSTIEYGPAPGLRDGTAAASDGRDFLVAWVDVRNRGNVAHLYAARMNAEGDVLDPLGIRIPMLQPAYRVDVVFLGETYLVYWGAPSPASPGFNALMGVRISRDGIVLDAAPRVLADRADRVSVAAHGAASNGNRTVIVYGSSMVVLDRDANVVRALEAIPTPGLAPIAPMVASNGRGFLVAWSRDGVRVIPLDENGVPVSSAATIVAAGTLLYGLASDGDSYVALLRDSGTTLSAQHISAMGEVMEASPLPLQQVFPGFVFSGGSYQLMDGDPVQHTVGIRRLDRTGKPVGSYVPLATAPSFGAGGTLATTGSETAMFWTEWNASAQLFNGGVMSAQASALAKTSTIARSANAQSSPAAATSGRNHAVTWTESGGTFAGRLTLDGQPLDGRGIHVGGHSLTAPAIVFDGANYVIGWIEQPSVSPLVNTVKVARLSADTGTLLDGGGITVASYPCASGLAISPQAYRLDVVFLGETYLVYWSEPSPISAASTRSWECASTVTASSSTPFRACSPTAPRLKVTFSRWPPPTETTF